MVSSEALSGPLVVRGVVRMCSRQVGGARAQGRPLPTQSNADVKGDGPTGPGNAPYLRLLAGWTQQLMRSC